MSRKTHSDTAREQPPRERCRALAGLAWLLGVVACSPTFEWRSVALPDTQLVTELPCRPARFQRDVLVAGVSLKMFMLSCETGGVTYGVATAEVGDPSRVDDVLHALRAGAAAAIGSSDSPARASSIEGATPFSGNSSAYLHGRRPDGKAVDEAVRVFARGTRVYQASAVGTSLPDDALRPFWDGLRFDLEKGAADPT